VEDHEAYKGKTRGRQKTPRFLYATQSSSRTPNYDEEAAMVESLYGGILMRFTPHTIAKGGNLFPRKRPVHGKERPRETCLTVSRINHE
jgi:hypothetical protein